MDVLLRIGEARHRRVRLKAGGGPGRLLVVAVWLAAAAVARAAEPQPYRIDVWKADEGLPQSSVTSIQQTRDGYLWLGTFGGLARFDGIQFKTFSTENLPQLPSSRFVALYEDRHGALWLATEEGSVVRLADGQVQCYSPPNRGTLARHVRVFAEPGDGVLWMATAEGQLLRLAGGRFSVPSTNWVARGTTVQALAVETSGRLWVGTEKELAVWQDGRFVTACDQTREENFGVDALASSRSGGLWVAGHGRLRHFREGQWAADYGAYPWSKGVISCLQEDRSGQVWLGTYGSGLFRYATNGAVLHLSKQEGFPGDLVRSFHEDREGNLWVGTEGRGLVRLKPAVFRSFTREQGLSSDLVLTVCEGQEGELWIGTNGEGINRLKDGVVRHYKANEGLSNECVWSVCQDRNQTVWAGTWGGGLFKLEGDSFVPAGSAAQCGPVVCALFADSQGGLWLGQPRETAEVIKLRDGEPVCVRLQTQAPRTDTRVITEDNQGNIWIGTRGDGLYRLSRDRQTHFGAREGLSSEFILSLYADTEGGLWVGTRKGLNWLRPGHVTAFTSKDGLPDDLICFITEDSHDNLWCSSGNGVFRVRKSELKEFTPGPGQLLRCFCYTRADGLPSLSCSSGCQPAGCKTRDGRVWFPTENGLAVVDPEQVPFNPEQPPVWIEEVGIEDQPHPLAMPSPSLAGQGGAEAELRVPPGRQRFEFHYAGLSFTAPEKVQFKYKLEGLEKDWVEAGTARAARYSYLAPGHYRFCVLACNNDGVWNPAGAAVGLVVLPHLWQTWWFRSLAAGFLLLLFVAAYEVRLASERRLTRLRLRIARDLHDEVGSNLGSIALLSEVMPKPAAGGAEEVSEIRRIALQTIESLRDIVWFLDPAADQPGDLVLRLRETARAMLPGIPFEFRASGEDTAPRLSLDLRRNIFPAFKEMLHNVVKHARATRVEIELEITPRHLRLSVRDNGTGFGQATVRSGNGLKNLHRRAAEAGGSFEIQSEPAGGTTARWTASIT